MRGLMFALALLPLAACTQPAPLAVNDAWARDTVGATATAAVFMTITSPTADRLISASTPAATKTDLMTMAMDGGAMAMIYVDGVDVPAGQTVKLEPGGLHVWLEGLTQPLAAGTTIPLTLTFQNAGERQVEVTVIGAAAAPPVSHGAM